MGKQQLFIFSLSFTLGLFLDKQQCIHPPGASEQRLWPQPTGSQENTKSMTTNTFHVSAFMCERAGETVELL